MAAGRWGHFVSPHPSPVTSGASHSETRLNTAHTQHTAHITDQTPGKYIHKKDKTGKTCFSFFLLAFPALVAHQSRLWRRRVPLKKIERENRHSSW
jgi:hypothetical protein